MFAHALSLSLLSLKLNVIPLVLQAKKKGLVMVNFFSYFLTCSNTSTVNDVVGNYISFFAPQAPAWSPDSKA